MAKQPALKPQDLIVALKLGANATRDFTFSSLAQELHMSVSETHASVRRALLSRLIAMEDGRMRANHVSLEEFVFHGVSYAFPAAIGSIARGIPTASSGPVLAKYFAKNEVDRFVWPHASGEVRGTALQPLYPSVPAAVLDDPKFYEVLTIVDAVRVGTARDRELAEIEFRKRLL